MKTFPATWNSAMVRATRFRMKSISSSRITWNQRTALGTRDQEPGLGTFSYREDGGSNSVDQQRLSAVPAELRPLPRVLAGSGEGVVSREAVVDVEPPQDAGPR